MNVLAVSEIIYDAVADHVKVYTFDVSVTVKETVKEEHVSTEYATFSTVVIFITYPAKFGKVVPNISVYYARVPTKYTKLELNFAVFTSNSEY